MMRAGIVLSGLAGLLLFVVALTAAVPIFPWTTFSKGGGAILQEAGLHASAHIAGCRTPMGEVEVIQWVILRPSGEQWVLYATISPPHRWVAIRRGPDDFPDLYYSGTYDGDAIRVVQSARFDRTKHGDGPCPYLVALPT